MRIAVIGANGRTGRLAVERALERGNEVVAVARRPETVSAAHGQLQVAKADVLDRDALRSVLAGVDAIISALGIGSSRQPTEVYSAGVANLLAEMASNGSRRLVVVSAAPAGPRPDHPGLEHKVVLSVLEMLFGETYKDMRKMEGVLQGSEADWTALRPPRLVAKPASGSYRMGLKPPAKGRTLTYGDLATALLDVIDRPETIRTAQYVSN